MTDRNHPASGEPESLPRLLREPAPDVLEKTFLGDYLRWVRQHRGLRFGSYEDLQRWSVRDLDAFWSSIWDYFQIRDHGSYERALSDPRMPGARWFEGSLINYAENALLGVGRTAPGPRSGGDDADTAIIGISQTRGQIELSFAELQDKVSRCRHALQQMGVGKGDRVVGYLPNIPEAAIAFLATASLGAIWAGCAPEFGAQGVIDRFAQIRPKVLFGVTGYTYGDKPVDRSAEFAQIRAGLPDLESTVVVPYGQYNSGAAPDSVDWTKLLSEGSEAEMKFEQVDFAHPLCVLFSSGTSGKPKAIMHSHGGFVVEHVKNSALSWDLQAGDRMVWATTTAWMVWNSLLSALLLRASIIMMDGNPMYPDLDNQWRMAEELEPTLMGVSPGFIMACRHAGIEPGSMYRLDSIRTLGASGSPLPEAGHQWVHENFGSDVVFNLGSGGTDVCTAFVQSGPWQRDWAGEMSGKCLGVNVVALDDGGHPVEDEFGELVVLDPMPSMPVGFWGDDGDQRYRASYFERYPSAWWHGDRIRFRSDTGSCRISGRSDATLNRGGVRMGTAEFYNVLEERPDVVDSLIVHLEEPAGGHGELVLFVATCDGELTTERRASIVTELRNQLSPRHVPDHIVLVQVIPRNRTGKKLEIPVKKVLTGVPVTDALSLESLSAAGAMGPVERFARQRIARLTRA
ncbi:acetoacetate--CoA ligase [Arthrobacter crystallopoietes]|uniref:Acetoacetyl-CoA synthetase n=1 Tax=Crystallibacter crystallopoietes TaxID=37928 RepID=A0A1H1CWW3_9MICC|nr:acetoacetate--CoA ligase [Arthrobacter crystallopoietes]SDQ68056.1 acetoacetyl-CoA synthetase [Arthrobacter crystallopoietes]